MGWQETLRLWKGAIEECEILNQGQRSNRNYIQRTTGKNQSLGLRDVGWYQKVRTRHQESPKIDMLKLLKLDHIRMPRCVSK